MKKLSCVALVLAMLAACPIASAGQFGLFGQENRDGAALDFASLLTVRPIELPDEIRESNMFAFAMSADASCALIVGGGKAAYLYDLESGEKIELYSIPEDSGAWEEIAQKIGSTSINSKAIYQSSDIDAFEFAMRFLQWTGLADAWGDTMLLMTPHCNVSINARTGETRPAEFDLFTPEGDEVQCSFPITSYTVTDRESKAQRQVTPEFDSETRCVSAFLPLSSGAIMVTRDAPLTQTEPMIYEIVLTGEDGRALNAISLGRYEALRGPDRIFCAGDAHIGLAYNRNPVLSGVLCFRSDRAEASALAWDGSALREIPLSEARDTDGKINYESNLLIPIGISDGSWALFLDMTEGALFLANLETLQVNFLLTPEERIGLAGDAMYSPYAPINLSMMRWTGGVRLFGKEVGLLELINRE